MTVIPWTALTAGLNRLPPFDRVQPNFRSSPRKMKNAISKVKRMPTVHPVASLVSFGHVWHIFELPRRNHPGSQLAQSTPVWPLAQRLELFSTTGAAIVIASTEANPPPGVFFLSSATNESIAVSPPVAIASSAALPFSAAVFESTWTVYVTLTPVPLKRCCR